MDNEFKKKNTSLLNRDHYLPKSDAHTQLCFALSESNQESFEKILKSHGKDSKINLDTIYYQNNKTCLDYACSMTGKSKYVKLLLEHGADINKYNEIHNRAPIHFAVENGDIETVKVLVNKVDIKLDLMAKGTTALHFAIREIKPLKDLNDDKNNKNKSYTEIAQLLLEAGTNVNIPDFMGITPIHLAAKQGLEDIVKLILDYSKNPVDLETYKDNNNETTKMLLEKTNPHLLQNLKLVSTPGTINMYKLFYYLYRCEEQQFIDDLNKISQEDALKSMLIEHNGEYTFIQIACKNGLEKVVKVLLDKGADPNLTAPHNEFKPIAYAYQGGYYKILELFKANEKLNFDQSHLQIIAKAEEKNIENANVDYKKCLQILLESGKASLDINYTFLDDKSNTALHYAVKSGNQDVVMELLKNGACLGIKNKFGEPPLLDISPKTLESYLDSCQYPNKECINSEKYEITFDYSFLKPPTNEGKKKSSDAPKNATPAPETDVLLYMSKHPNLKNLLKHPVITSFLHMKWYRISHMYYCNLLMYFLFWLSLNLYILLGAEEYDETVTSGILIQIFKVLTVTGIIIITIREIMQIMVAPNKYWKSLENWLELTLIIVCYMSVVLNNFFEMQQLQAIAILLSSAELVLLIGRYPTLSTNIVMLKTVSWNFFKFLLWYCILIIAFALSFHTLFKQGNNKTKNEFYESKGIEPNKSENESENTFFFNPGISLFKTIIMLTGEFEATHIDFKQSILCYLVFILFVFMIPVVLFNLLNGLAVSDTQAIKLIAELVSIVARIELISYFEGILLGGGNRNAQNRCYSGNYCMKPKNMCIRPLAEKICLFPNYLPMAKISVKVNQNSKIKIILGDSESKNINPRDICNVEIGSCCLTKCLELKMDEQIIKSAQSIISEKENEGTNDIRDVYLKLEELQKDIRNLTNVKNSLP